MNIERYSCLVLVTLATMGGGCCPYRFTARPGASGAVVDADGRTPIAGAQVTLVASRGQGSAITASDGGFTIPAVRQWGVYIVPMDPIRWHTTVTVRAADYGVVTQEFITFTTGPAMTSLGEIRMERLSK